MTSTITDQKPNDDINIVEMLRVKTEEADMNSYLKSTFGGYTKKSVLDYLAILRKQQQTMAENFNSNFQTHLEEKECIKRSYAALQIKLNKIESEYKNLSEAMLASQSDNPKHSVQDIPELKKAIAALEEELKRSKMEYKLSEGKLQQLENTNQNLVIKLEQVNKEADAQKEMLAIEKSESKKQRDLISKLSGLLEGERDEVKYWKSLQYDGQVAELTEQINKLADQLAVQTEVIARQNSDNLMKEETIETLSALVDTLKNKISSMSESLACTNLQNDKLVHANKALRERLEEENKKSITLIQEKSDANIEKFAALKRLSEANGKLSMMDMERNKNTKLEEINHNKME